MDYSILQQCMHCGMCLPTCPTYVSTRMERNSPRGRIAWMRAIADGDMPLGRAFADEMYYCLGCLACTTACPAGVNYPDLFEAARADVEEHKAAGRGQRDFWRWLAVKTVFMHPRLLRFVGRGIWFYQASGLQGLLRMSGLFRLLPRGLRELEPQTPTVRSRFSHQLIRTETAPRGKAAYRVGLLTGCVQDLVFSDINRDTVEVLVANNCAVFTPPLQPCCGSLHAHNGELELARRLARRQLDLFDLDALDAVITNAGGCGSHLKHYGRLLADDPVYAERAGHWDRKCKDIHEWLVEIKFRRPKPSGTTFSSGVTYHESCHLCHGQKVTGQPRQILDAIPGLRRCELPESDWCCGSAGIYNITQPEQANQLLQRKLGHLSGTGCELVATANPGCHLQLQNGLKQSGQLDTQVTHPVSLLAQAYRNESRQ
jgi:glycolate oxidase iron-sulfur subunit